ncbi:MAG: ribonuclease III [Myxococcota bacterium]
MSEPAAIWALYIQALTHTSYAQEHGGHHNERLEFIGDAVLGLCASRLLFERFPDADEGKLSRMRRQVVNNANLARLARQLSLGEALRLGRGERRSGGPNRESNLAGAYEALLGAIYLDQGVDAVMSIVRTIIFPMLDDLPNTRNSKQQLLEWVQKNHHSVPRYSLVSTSGPDHKRRFRMSVRILGEIIAEGEGTSKQKATFAAAKAAIVRLKEQGRMS